MSLIHDLLFDYTLRNIILGTLLLGITSGAVGVFTLLRKQSLLGDSISHAALPGIAFAFLLTGSRHSLILLTGAALSGWIGTLLILLIIRRTRIDPDGAQGVILSVFFGTGLLLLTFIQKIPSSSQAGLDKFIFGQAAALLLEDIVFMTVIGFGIMAILLIFWKEFKIMTFNPEYAEALGFSRTRIDLIMTVMIVTVIIVGLQTAGVILMSALLIAPAASARQWTDRLGPMVVVSSLIGAVSGICGALLSSAIQKMPTGPAITVVLTLIFLFSILFGPRRGILSRMIRFQENRKNFAVQGLIVDLYQLAVEHESLFHEHSIETLKAIRPAGENIRQGLKALEISGYAIHREGRLWSLTGDGIKKAQEIIRGEEDGN